MNYISIKAIKTFMLKSGYPLTIRQIAKHFSCQITEIEYIIELWQAKGKIAGYKNAACQSCPLAKNCENKFIWKIN